MAHVALREATYSDLEAVPPHLVAEIIDGVLDTHPRPRSEHASAASRLSGKLEPAFGFGAGGWIFMVAPELHLGSDIVVPDLAGWRRERLSRFPDSAFVELAPDWACEILSPSTARLDRGPKRRIYAEAGVAHLWLLDPLDRQLEAFALTADRWLLQATIRAGEIVQAPPFDAAPFPLGDLFPFDAAPSPVPEA